MRRSVFFVLAFLVAIPLSSFAATDPARQAAQQRGTQNPAEGVWYVYDKNNILLREEHYQSYRLEGDVKTFYPSGAIKDWSKYVDGSRQGPNKTYFESGAVSGEFTYLDNNIEGQGRQYFPTGELQSVGQYTKGNLDGEKKTYFVNGNIAKVATYINGVLDGTVLVYKEDGSLLSEEMYKNGTLIGRRDLTQDNLFVTTSKAVPAPQKPPAPTPKPTIKKDEQKTTLSPAQDQAEQKKPLAKP